MNRRDFIMKTGTVGAAAFLPLTSCSPGPYQMGLQLFSVREPMQEDALGTLKAVKEMGYRHFETYGYDPEKNDFYGYSAPEFKTVLDDLELTATSGHFNFYPLLDRPVEELDRFVDQCIVGASDLDMEYITWPWIAPEQRNLETWKRMPALLNRIGERVTAAGLGFAYHNHDFEFTDYDGQTGYEIILAETDPELVKLQIDMFWVMHSSQLTPKEWVEKQAGRFVMWHIKDMHKVSRDYTELGNGSIDYVNVLPEPHRAGLEFYYLEQGGNFTHDPLRSAADSAAFFQRELQHLI